MATKNSPAIVQMEAEAAKRAGHQVAMNHVREFSNLTLTELAAALLAVPVAAHEQFPQYEGHWVSFVPVRVNLAIRTKGGMAFEEGDVSLGKAEPTEKHPERFVVYSIRNGMNTAVPRGVEVLSDEPETFSLGDAMNVMPVVEEEVEVVELVAAVLTVEPKPTPKSDRREVKDGKGRSLWTTLTDDAARQIAGRIAASHRDFAFASELASLRRLSPAQTFWLHRFAIDQLGREDRPESAPAVVPPPPPPAVVPQVANDEVDENLVASLRPCMLQYDIPNTSRIANPTAVLRRLALRTTLSVWVIPEANIPYRTLDEMREAGATWHVVRFDVKEGRNLVNLAIFTARQELNEAMERAQQSMAEAQRKMEGAEAGEDRTRAVEAMYTRAKEVKARVEKMIEDMTTAAEQFGITPGMLGLVQTRTAVESIRKSMTNRAQLFTAAHAMLRKYNSAVLEGTPIGILADLLGDRDEAECQKLSREVYAAFAGVAGTMLENNPPQD